MVGRSKAPDGPYVDRDGKSMMHDGGFLVLHADLDQDHRFKGPGEISILREPGRDSSSITHTTLTTAARRP